MNKKIKNEVLKTLSGIVLVLFILFFTEITLRILLKTDLQNERSKLYRLNRNFYSTNRLFENSGEGVYTNTAFWEGSRRIQYQNFRIPKPEDTFRIFCIGGSSVTGIPYNGEPQKAFPGILSRIVGRYYRDVEVINAGVGAYCSEHLIKITEELIEYEPDCIILYTGHNDYGYFFWDPDILNINRFVLNIDLLLNKSYIYRLIVRYFDRTLTENKDHLPQILESEFEGNKLIVKFRNLIPDEKWSVFVKNKLHLCGNQLQNNILKIKEITDNTKTAFIICTVVSNLRDFAPFVSPYSETDTAVLRENIGTARKFIKLNKPAEAINILSDHLKTDKLNAEIHFLLGKSYYLLDEFDTSRSYFIKARDLSPLYSPYQRAPSSVNELIRKICADYNIALADIEKVMFQLDNGAFIPGDDFFADNIHPNTTGYAFIAETIFQRLKQDRIIERKAE